MIILRQKHKNPVVYLLSGLPGSGKSRWCKKNYPNLPVISRDIIRYTMGYTSGPHKKRILLESDENKITNEENKQILELLRSKKDFIIDDTNLKIKYRKPLLELLKSNGAYIIGVNFDTPLNVCIERRELQINPEIMKNLYKNADKLQESEVDELINV